MKELFAKFIDAPLNTLDKGELFQKGIYYSLVLIAGLLVLLGVFGTIGAMFVNGGYIDRLFNMEGFQIARGIFGSIFTVIISMVTMILVALIVLKRANDLNAKPYQGLLHYLYREYAPTMIKIFGEGLAVLPIMMALTGFISALFGAYTHSLLGEIAGGSNGPAAMLLGGGGVIYGFGPYMTGLGMSIGAILGSVLVSFLILLSTYVALEVYNYMVLLVTNLVKFLPRFAFPLWLQKSERGGGNIDSNDL